MVGGRIWGCTNSDTYDAAQILTLGIATKLHRGVEEILFKTTAVSTW